MRERRYRLRPWLIRSLLPQQAIGAYVLWDSKSPFYIGRSDTSLQRRLIEHSRLFDDAYFTFDVSNSMLLAFDMECSLYHALQDAICNQIHPGKPAFSTIDCTFCATSLHLSQLSRLPQPLSKIL